MRSISAEQKTLKQIHHAGCPQAHLLSLLIVQHKESSAGQYQWLHSIGHHHRSIPTKWTATQMPRTSINGIIDPYALLLQRITRIAKQKQFHQCHHQIVGKANIHHHRIGQLIGIQKTIKLINMLLSHRCIDLNRDLPALTNMLNCKFAW